MDMKKLMNEPIFYFNKITLNCMLFFMEMMMNIYIFFLNLMMMKLMKE